MSSKTTQELLNQQPDRPFSPLLSVEPETSDSAIFADEHATQLTDILTVKVKKA